jgi:hypothetical protein
VFAAKVHGTSARTIERLRFIERHGVPELMVRLDNEEISLATAEVIARIPHKEQKELIAMGPRAVRLVVKDIRRGLEPKIKESLLRDALADWGMDPDDIEQVIARSKE